MHIAARMATQRGLGLFAAETRGAQSSRATVEAGQPRWWLGMCSGSTSEQPDRLARGTRARTSRPAARPATRAWGVNRGQPVSAGKRQVRAGGRDCPYRQARLSACPHWQAQQARRPSTQSPKHLAAQPSSASERQDKEAACGPHSGMDSIAHRWYRSGEGPVFARPVLHRKSVRGTI